MFSLAALGARWEQECQRLPAPFSRSVLFIADKYSLVSSSRDRGGGGGGGGGGGEGELSLSECGAAVEETDAFIASLTERALNQLPPQLFLGSLFPPRRLDSLIMEFIIRRL